jgi:hypothetical protein
MLRVNKGCTSGDHLERTEFRLRSGVRERSGPLPPQPYRYGDVPRLESRRARILPAAFALDVREGKGREEGESSGEEGVWSLSTRKGATWNLHSNSLDYSIIRERGATYSTVPYSRVYRISLDGGDEENDRPSTTPNVPEHHAQAKYIPQPGRVRLLGGHHPLQDDDATAEPALRVCGQPQGPSSLAQKDVLVAETRSPFLVVHSMCRGATSGSPWWRYDHGARR